MSGTALTAEDWAVVLSEDLSADDEWENRFAETCGRHETAARALHGQPFGFTWEDVDLLLAETSILAPVRDEEEGQALYDLANRIAALLPPRDTK